MQPKTITGPKPRLFGGHAPRFLEWPYYLIFVLLFLLEGVFAVAVAIADLRSSDTTASFGVGLAWSGISLLAFLAAFACVTRRAWWVIPSFVASLLGILTAFYVIWAAYRSPTARSWAQMAWIAVIAFLAAVIAFGHAIHLSPVRSSRAALATLLSLAGIGQFWYSSQYAPTLESPTLSVASTLSVAAAAQQATGTAATVPLSSADPVGPMIPVDATISLHNTSHARVQVIHSLFQVTGTSLVQHISQTGDGTSVSEWARNVNGAFGWTQDAPNYLAGLRPKEGPPSLLAMGQVTQLTEYFDPGEEKTKHVALFVPKDTYQTLQLSVTMEVAKASQLKLGNPTSCEDNPSRVNGPVDVLPDSTNMVFYSCVRRRIVPSSPVYRWVAETSYVDTQLWLSDLRPHGSPLPVMNSVLGTRHTLNVSFDERLAQRLADKYGVIVQTSDFELILPRTVCSGTPCPK